MPCFHLVMSSEDKECCKQLPRKVLFISFAMITFAVLKMTFLQSGRMLTDQAGRKYKFPLNVTFASEIVP